MMSLTGHSVIAASRLLSGIVLRTPLLNSELLNATLGLAVLCKAEPLQRTGSFKFRGAYHAVARLTPEQRKRGIVAASSGNHARAIALTARLLGIPSTVVVPHDGPTVKIQAARQLGATVITYHRTHDDREAIVESLATTHGWTIIPSSNSVEVMAGAGTVALEMLRQCPDIATLLVPVGGGGLAAGCVTIAKKLNPGISVIGVEPANGADTLLSLRQGYRVQLPTTPQTIADGLTHTIPYPLPFEINKRLLDEVITVTDSDTVDAMALCLRHLNLVVEPSGAVALAALTAGRIRRPGTFGVVLSGGNISPEMLAVVLGIDT